MCFAFFSLAYALAERIAAASPAAVRGTVKLLRQVCDRTRTPTLPQPAMLTAAAGLVLFSLHTQTRRQDVFKAALDAEAEVQGAVCTSGDLAIGLEAVVQKKNPLFGDFDPARARL